MKHRALILLTLAGVIIATSLQAVNWSPVLKDSPMSHFSDEDMDLLDDATTEALNTGADGSEVTWANPVTGASGTVIPMRSEKTEDSECRLLRFINRADGMTGDSRFWFCKMPDGSWKITSPPPAK